MDVGSLVMMLSLGTLVAVLAFGVSQVRMARKTRTSPN